MTLPMIILYHTHILAIAVFSGTDRKSLFDFDQFTHPNPMRQNHFFIVVLNRHAIAPKRRFCGFISLMTRSTKDKYALGVIFVASAGILLLGGNSASTLSAPVARTNPSPSPAINAPVSAGIPSVMIGQTVVPVELATTTGAVEKGLSGRASLDAQSGMLFIFLKPFIYHFWMPDMRFPLDIIWINNGKVVDISENVSNEFDPVNPRFYAPSKPVRYVLEVNAGFAARTHIQIGDEVSFYGI